MASPNPCDPQPRSIRWRVLQKLLASRNSRQSRYAACAGVQAPREHPRSACQPVVQTRQQGLGQKKLGAHRRQLDSEGETVEPEAERVNYGCVQVGEAEARSNCLSALNKQGHRRHAAIASEDWGLQHGWGPAASPIERPPDGAPSPRRRAARRVRAPRGVRAAEPPRQGSTAPAERRPRRCPWRWPVRYRTCPLPAATTTRRSDSAPVRGPMPDW